MVYFKDHIHVYFFTLSPIFGTSISGFINLKQLKLQLSEDTGAASGSVGEVSPVHVQNIVTQPVTWNNRSKSCNSLLCRIYFICWEGVPSYLAAGG